MKVVTEEEYKEFIGTGTKLVQFSADWCGPCRMLTSTFDNMEEIEIVKVNIDNSRDLAMSVGIKSIPVVVKYQDGKEVNRFVGMRNRNEILDFIGG